MKENVIKFTYHVIFLLTLLVTAFCILFFLPLTAEFFEFNKFTFLLFATIISSLLWAFRMILQKKFSFTKSPINTPLLLLLIVFFIAAISAIDQRIAVWGIPQKPWPSFVSLLTLAVFYFVAASNIRTKKSADWVLYTLVGSTTIAAIVSIASYFGVFFPADFAAFRTFNTLGSASNLALLESVVISLTISWIVFSKKIIPIGLAILSTAINLTSLVLISFLPAYAGLLIGLLLVGAVVLKTGKIPKPAQFGTAIIILLAVFILAVRYIPQAASPTLSPLIISRDKSLEISKNVTLPQNTSWDIATSTIGKRPLFGTGPGTYLFAYTQLKPRSVNSESFWFVRFDKASSDFTEFIATIGIIGALVFLFFIATVVRFIWGLLFKNNNPSAYLPASAAIFAFIVSEFFAVSSLPAITAFFVALSSLVVLAKTRDEKHVHEITVEIATLKNSFNWLPVGNKLGLLKTTESQNTPKSQVLPVFFLAVLGISSFILARNQISTIKSEYYYRQALLSASRNDGNSTIQNLQKAIGSNPAIDTYHRELSATALNAALTLSQQNDLTDAQRQLVGQLAQVAIDQGKIASGYQILPLRVPGISASSTANWETLSAAYQSLIGQLSGADVNALNTLAQALALDPQNPVLHHKLGALYLKIKNLDSAQRKFEDAAVTKEDYGPAHWELAKLLIEKNGDVVRIATELTLAKKYLPQNDPAIPQIDKLLEEYNVKAQELQKQQNQTQTESTTTPTSTPSGSPSLEATPKPSPSPTVKPGL